MRFATKIDIEALHAPVPDMTVLRQLKRSIDYRRLPIDLSHPLSYEPLVDIGDYGVRGQAFYSHDNEMTGGAVPGVRPEVLVRKSLAESLADINAVLAHDALQEAFGGRVALFVHEGYRPRWLQQALYDRYYPAQIRAADPDISDAELASKLSKLISNPSKNPDTSPSHETGAVVDVWPQWYDANPAGNLLWVPMSRPGTDRIEFNQPDCLETDELSGQIEDYYTLKKHHRLFYNVMCGRATGGDTGLVVNPDEWWHWGRGDQLSALVRGQPAAIYSFAE